MSALTEEATWEASISEIETTDRVLGGPEGKINIQSGQLANRTAYLKEQQENHAANLAAHQPRYTDAEAVASMGAKSDVNPLNHDRHTPSEILADLINIDGPGSGLDADLLDGQQAVDFAAASHTHPPSGGSGPPEPWVYVAPNGSSAPSYEWGWENQPWDTGLRFYKHNDRVYLEGGIFSGDPMMMGVVFNLPEGYWPAQNIYFICQAVQSNGANPPGNPTFGLGNVSPTGDVMIWASGTGTADMFSLSQVSFRMGVAPGGP